MAVGQANGPWGADTLAIIDQWRGGRTEKSISYIHAHGNMISLDIIDGATVLGQLKVSRGSVRRFGCGREVQSEIAGGRRPEVAIGRGVAVA